MSFEGWVVVRVFESNIWGVVEEVGGVNGRVFFGLDDWWFEVVEGEEVGDFVVVVLEIC